MRTCRSQYCVVATCTTVVPFTCWVATGYHLFPLNPRMHSSLDNVIGDFSFCCPRFAFGAMARRWLGAAGKTRREGWPWEATHAPFKQQNCCVACAPTRVPRTNGAEGSETPKQGARRMEARTVWPGVPGMSNSQAVAVMPAHRTPGGRAADLAEEKESCAGERASSATTEKELCTGASFFWELCTGA